jgi:hypothetical protein
VKPILGPVKARPAMSAAFVLSILWILWTAYKVWRPPHNPNGQGFIIVPAAGVYFDQLPTAGSARISWHS